MLRLLLLLPAARASVPVRAACSPLAALAPPLGFAASARRRLSAALCSADASSAVVGARAGGTAYADLAHALHAVEQEAATLDKVSVYAALLERAWRRDPADLNLCLALTTLQLAPAEPPLKFGLGESLILEAIASATGAPLEELQAQLGELGDAGDLAAARLADADPAAPRASPLLLADVHAALIGLQAESGAGANGRRAERLAGLLRRAEPVEACHVVRAVRGKQRTGLSSANTIAALAQAATAVYPDPSAELAAAEEDAVVAEAAAAAAEAEAGAEAARAGDGAKPAKEAAKVARKRRREANAAAKRAEAARGASRRAAVAALRERFSVSPCYPALVRGLLDGSPWDLGPPAPAPGTPVQPMAATAAVSVDAVLDRLGGRPFLAEPKYDGERCQIHVISGAADGAPTVRLYSRSLDEMTVRFPDAVSSVRAALADGTSSAIFDAEVCAYDADGATAAPFAALAARSRKAPTEEQMAATPVCLYLFDILHRNGASMLGCSLRERRAALAESLTTSPSVRLSGGVEVRSREELEAVLADAVEAGSEGLMCKALGGGAGGGGEDAEGTAEGDADSRGAYEAGKRSLHWLKLKRDYIDALGDSFDLVPIGAYLGAGKRAGGYGAFLLGCWDADGRKWQPVCKLGTGFTDDDLARWSAEFGAPRANDADDADLDGWLDLPAAGALPPAYRPHAWLRPSAASAVWEVRAASLSLSPTFRAAIGQVTGEPSRGLALRFPRYVRHRPDKAPAGATTSRQLLEAFETQPEAALAAANGNGASAGSAVESDPRRRELEALSRRELQTRAKAARVRANQSSAALIAALLSSGDE